MPLLTIAMAEVPRRDSGLASGFSNVMMLISAAIGLAALGTIATDRSRALLAQGHTLAGALTDGYRLAFVIAAVCLAIGLLVAAVILRSPYRADVAQVPEEPVAMEEAPAVAIAVMRRPAAAARGRSAQGRETTAERASEPRLRAEASFGRGGSSSGLIQMKRVWTKSS